MRYLPALLLLAAASAAAQADGRWVYVAGTEDSAEYYDRKSVRCAGAVCTAWGRSDFTAVQLIEGPAFTAVVQRHELDCARREGRTLALVLYRFEEAVYEDAHHVGRRLPALPGTVLEAVLDGVCAAGRRARGGAPIAGGGGGASLAPKVGERP